MDNDYDQIIKIISSYDKLKYMVKIVSFIMILFGLIIAGVIIAGCASTKEEVQGNLNEKVNEKIHYDVIGGMILGPGATSRNYYIIIPDSTATDFTLTSDVPVNIDCPDWIDIDKKGVTNFHTRIYTTGSANGSPRALPPPGSKLQITNPDPSREANIQINLTGIKI